jgi:hypothetical protein
VPSPGNLQRSTASQFTRHITIQNTTVCMCCRSSSNRHATHSCYYHKSCPVGLSLPLGWSSPECRCRPLAPANRVQIFTQAKAATKGPERSTDRFMCPVSISFCFSWICYTYINSHNSVEPICHVWHTFGGKTSKELKHKGYASSSIFNITL